MSHRIANKSDVLDYCGQIPLRTGIQATVKIDKILPNSPIVVDQVFTVLNTPQDVGEVTMYMFESISAGILVAEYYPGQTVDVYAISENALELCGTGIISMTSIDNKLPRKDEVLTFWNCLLKDPSAGYYDIQLVRQEDLMAPERQEPEYVRYYFNSAYVKITVLNRNAVAVIDSSDTPFPKASTDDALLFYTMQKEYCKSYMDCRVGDTITIQIKENSQIEHDAYIWDIAYDDNGILTSMDQHIDPPTDALDLLCRRKEITFQIKPSMYSLSSEYFVMLSYPEFYYPVHGIWVNPIQELSDGTHPTCVISIVDRQTAMTSEIYRHDETQTTSMDEYFSFGKELSVVLYIDPSTAVPTEITVTVTGDDGQEIASSTLSSINSVGVGFTMPKQRCTVTVTTKGFIDNSTVLSSVLSVSDYTKWNKSRAVINNIELVCHADEDIVVRPNSSEKYSDNNDYRHEFIVNIPKSKWQTPSSTINASLRISLTSTYRPSISSLLTDNTGVAYPTITADDAYKYISGIDMRSNHFLLKRNSASAYDFILKLQLVKDKSYQIKCILAGEPFIIKTTEPDQNVAELKKLVTGGYYGDWQWTQPSVVGFMQRQYGDIYGTGYNITVPFYTFIIPYSNIGKLPEYVTPKIGSGDRYNHGLGQTHESQVVLSSELTLPSTVTTMGGVEGINALPALQYAGFYKVSAPGLVEEIPPLSFKGNFNLQEFTVPDGVYKICEKAFAGAGTYYNTGQSSKPFSINLNKTTEIQMGAFAQACIKKLTIPAFVINIDEPLYYPGALISPCYIEDLTWNKINETRPLNSIFTSRIWDSLKTLTIGTNVNTLPAGFVVVKGDVLQAVTYLGTTQMWEEKFGDTIFKFHQSQRPIKVKCTNGSLTYFDT